MPLLQDEAGAPLSAASTGPHEPGDETGEPAPGETPTRADAHTDIREDGPHTSAAASASGTGRARRRGLFALLAGVAVVSYAADQVGKAWAIRSLSDQPPRDVLGSFLRLELIRNPGAAFSIGTGNTWVLTLIAVVVLVVVVRTSRRLGSTGWAWALGLLLGGALGNLTDRLVREPGFGQGHVVDFIDYNGWFIGNVADVAIVSAAVLIGLLAVTGRGVDGTRETRGTRQTLQTPETPETQAAGETQGKGRDEPTGHGG